MKNGIEIPSSEEEIVLKIKDLSPAESLSILSQETPGKINFFMKCARRNNHLATYYVFKLFEKAYSKNSSSALALVNAKTQERTPIYIAAQENNAQFLTHILKLLGKHKAGLSTKEAGPLDCPSALVAAAKVGACEAVVAICNNQDTGSTKKDIYEIYYNPLRRGNKTLLDYLALSDKTGDALFSVLNNSESHGAHDFHVCTKEVDEMGYSAFHYLLQNPNCTAVLTNVFSQISLQWRKGWTLDQIFDFKTKRANGYTDLELAIKQQDPQLLVLLEKIVDPKFYKPALVKISAEIAEIAQRQRAEDEERVINLRAQQQKAAEDAKQKADQQRAADLKQKADIKARYEKKHADELKAQEEARKQAQDQKAMQIKAIEDAKQKAEQEIAAQLQAVRGAVVEFKKEQAHKLKTQSEAQEIASSAIAAPLKALEVGVKASIAREEQAIDDKFIAANAPGFDPSWQPYLERLHAVDRNVSLLQSDNENSEWRRERFNENLSRIHESQSVELEALKLNWKHIKSKLPIQTVENFLSLDTSNTLASVEARNEILNEINAILITEKIRLNDTFLNLSNCYLTRIPDIFFEIVEDLAYWEKLKHIDCNDNMLLTLPRGLEKCQALESLNCRSNRLSEIPENLMKFPHLKYFDCSNNRLSSLPLELQNSQTLKTLDCSENQIKLLPPKLGISRSVTELRCNDNQLQSLPEHLSRCHSLAQLNCSNNFISHLPRLLGKTRNLEILDCSNNQIRLLPSSLGKSRKVKINCANNFLESIPHEITANLGDNWASEVLSEQKPLQEWTSIVENQQVLDEQSWTNIDSGEETRFSRISKDVLGKILSYLSENDVNNLALVCKSLHADLSSDKIDVVWSPYLNRLKALDPNFSIQPPSNAQQFAWRRARFKEGFEKIRQRQMEEIEVFVIVFAVSMFDNNFSAVMEKHADILEKIKESMDSGNQFVNTLDDLEAVNLLLNDVNDFFVRQCIQPEQTTLDLNMGGLGFFTRFPDSALRDETLQPFWENLRELRCRENMLQSLPDLSRCKALEQIDVSFNQLQSLPNALGNLPALQSLNVEGNELKRLPATLADSKSIIMLNCARNELTSLPKCSALRSVNCSFNRLQSLPALDVQVLEELSFDHNNVMSVPSELKEKFGEEWASENIDKQQKPQVPNVGTELPPPSRSAPLASALELRKGREQQDVKPVPDEQASKLSPESKLRKQ